MNLQQNNFGLEGQGLFSDYDGDYDHLFKKMKERRETKREDRQTERTDRKDRKTERKSERQEKRELSTEKKRLKNEMRQTQIDEKKSQLAILNQQGQQQAQAQPAPAPSGGDNTLIIVVSIVGVMGLSLVGWFAFRKQNPGSPQLIKTA